MISAGYSLMNEEQYTTSGFQSTSLPETIWGYTWAASTSLGNRSFASFMSITAVDNANNKGIYMAIDDQLYNQIAATDYRKKNFNGDRDHGRGVHLSRPIRTSSSIPRPTRLTKSTCACRRHTC